MTKRFCNRCGKEIPPCLKEEAPSRYRFTIQVGRVQDSRVGGTSTDIIWDDTDLCDSCWHSVEIVLRGRTP